MCKWLLHACIIVHTYIHMVCLFKGRFNYNLTLMQQSIITTLNGKIVYLLHFRVEDYENTEPKVDGVRFIETNTYQNCEELMNKRIQCDDDFLLSVYKGGIYKKSNIFIFSKYILLLILSSKTPYVCCNFDKYLQSIL